MVEVPTPLAQPGMALVQTAASLVSAGTERMLVDFASKSLLGKARSRPDLARQVFDKARREGVLTTVEAAFNRLEEPMPLGYSSAGTIAGIGEGIQGFKVGQRVACGGGGYAVHAEYALVPQNLLAALPDNVDFESAAFTTLGAIALHGFRLAEASVGEQVTVIGLGLLGLLTVAIANAAGCKVLGIDLDPNRVQLAKEMGAEVAVTRDEAEAAAQSISRGRGSDVILICADTRSSDPVKLAGTIARDKAKVVATGAVGLEIPRKVYYEKELSFINSRSYGPGRYDPSYEEDGQDYPIGYVRWTEGRNLESFIDLLSSKRINVHPLITHRFPIEQAPKAYDLIAGDSDQPFLGILLTYGSKEPVESEVSLPTDDQLTIGQIQSEQQTEIGSGKIKLGLLGAGNFASAVMLPALSKVNGIELTGVASASGLSAQNAANRFNFRYATSDENNILEDPAINTVAILTRHHLHARQAIAALNAGKHVFCEKPLAITSQELEEVFGVLDKISGHSQVLMVGFNRRFAPFSQRLKAFLGDRQEPLMANYRVNAGYLPASHWLHDLSQGGGRIIGEGCHFIDFLTFLVGDPPKSVAAFALPDEGHYQEDNVHLSFTFPDGSIGTVDYLANGDKAFPKERLEVFTAGQVAVLDDFRTLELVQNGKRQYHRARLRQDKGHRTEWQTFADAVIHGDQPPIPYNQLYGVSMAAICAVESLRTGDSVSIPSRIES
ncbi:MAG: bi-domain-containing oxidoreductase [Chloroflexi bacterium]|nr:bi-domain-containing oxidoreductase [Chloroflexota bacterium]